MSQRGGAGAEEREAGSAEQEVEEGTANREQLYTGVKPYSGDKQRGLRRKGEQHAEGKDSERTVIWYELMSRGGSASLWVGLDGHVV
eukprot:2719421-Rhodomonas_salina.1